MSIDRRGYLAALGTVSAGLAGCATLGKPRGRGEPIAVTRSYEDSDAVEYLEGTGEVREVVSTAYETPIVRRQAFERWARRTSLEIGARAVHDAVDTRLPELSNFTSGVRHRFLGMVIEIVYLTRYEHRNGTVRTPSVGFDRVVGNTPRHVDVTLDVGGRRYSTREPVILDKTRAGEA